MGTASRSHPTTEPHRDAAPPLQRKVSPSRQPEVQGSPPPVPTAACPPLTLVVGEGVPILLGVLLLLQHHQLPPLHVHAQRVLLRLADLGQVPQGDVQLHL